MTSQVRDSKLQRLSQAFRHQLADGEYKKWTFDELVEIVGNQMMANMYISILRSEHDRFKMRIVKHDGCFQYRPLPSLEALNNQDKVALLHVLMEETGLDTVISQFKMASKKADAKIIEFLNKV